LIRHPEAGNPFNRYMGKTSEHHTEALLLAYDFAGIGTLMDIGRRLGGTLMTVLTAYPTLRGMIYDLPSVVKEAATALAAAGLADRCVATAGTCSAACLGAGTPIFSKWVLMDRSDERAVEVLRRCAEAMEDDGRVLVVEMAMPPDNRPSFARVMDLQMLLLFGDGRIRTEVELRALFGAGGLKVTRVIAAPPSPNVIVKGRAA
jgi:hypothetical protein